MTTQLSNAWLTDVRKEYKSAGRRIFMIMDNCPSHKVLKPDDAEVVTHVLYDINVIQVDNLYCVMLPPNATALI